jgi:nuclear fragile X mental retardation-interacting protein 1
MALPSPCFTENIPKPAAPEKTHVVREELKKPNQFIAYCKFCQEGFASENDLSQHRKSHEKCPYDDCKFNANEKAIAEHVQRVHLKSSTLVKIQDLTTPEQVEKWKEERRKRYPTTANILLRQQVQEERFERGEKLQVRQQRFSDFKQRDFISNGDKTHQKNGKGNKRFRDNEGPRKPWIQKDSKKPRIENSKNFKDKNNREDVVQKKKRYEKTNEDLSEEEEARATPCFKGTSQMKDYHDVQELVKERPALSILGMYGSDSNSEDEDERITLNTPISEEKPVFTDHQEKNDKIKVAIENPTVILSDNDDPPEETPIEHSSIETEACTSLSKGKLLNPQAQKNGSKDRKNFIKPPRSALDYSKLASSRPTNPFLEKLLQEDIRHERSVLLQCVNFVVRNNFFDTSLQILVTNEKSDDLKILSK